MIPNLSNSPSVATVAYRFRPEENPAPRATPSISMGFMPIMIASWHRPEDSYFCSHSGDVPFDVSSAYRDAVHKAVIHAWSQPPLLSLGIYSANPRDRSLRSAAA